jgi:hypothetical protein
VLGTEFKPQCCNNNKTTTTKNSNNILSSNSLGLFHKQRIYLGKGRERRVFFQTPNAEWGTALPGSGWQRGQQKVWKGTRDLIIWIKFQRANVLLEEMNPAGYQWLTPVILATQGGRDQEDCGSKPACANSSQDLITKKGWWNGSKCGPWVQTPVSPKNKQNKTKTLNEI